MKDKATIKYLLFGIMFLSFILALHSVYILMTGMHNVDLGQNIRYLNAEYGLTLVDTNSAGIQWSGEEMYIYGQNNIKEAFWKLGLAMFLIGGSLVGVIKS